MQLFEETLEIMPQPANPAHGLQPPLIFAFGKEMNDARTGTND